MTLTEAFISVRDFPAARFWHPDPDTIIDAVARFSGVPFTAFMTVRHRRPRETMARMLAMYLIRERTPLSFPAIGRIFDRDHSTVIHGCRLIARRMEAQPDFAKSVGRLGERLTQGWA